MIYFDTHRAVEHMTKAGLNKEMAESIVDIINTKNDSLATKSDLRHEITDLRNELKSEISDLRNELKSDIAEVKKNIEHLREQMATKADILAIKADMSIAQNDTTKWMFGLFITLMLTIIGLSFK